MFNKIEMKNGDTLHYDEGKVLLLNSERKANNALAVITDNPMIPAFVLFTRKKAKELNDDEKIAALQACIDVSPKFEEYLKGVVWRPVIHEDRLLYLASPDFTDGNPRVGIFDVPTPTSRSDKSIYYFHCYREEF
jgi:hypothetical protein